MIFNGTLVLVVALLTTLGTSDSCGRGATSSNSNQSSNSETNRGTNSQESNSNVLAENQNKDKSPNETSGSDEQWGGNHVTLVMKSKGGELEFDCAHGTIETITSDKEGNFDVAGTFVREGGPTRSDDDGKGLPVRYVGRITQDSITFQIHFKDSNQPTEPFTLTRGSRGRLWKCR